MVRLKVNPFVGHGKQTINFNQRQDPFDFKFTREAELFNETLDTRFIEFNLRVSTSLVVETLDKLLKHLFDFTPTQLIVESVGCFHFSVESGQCLKQSVKLSIFEIEFKFVFL